MYLIAMAGLPGTGKSTLARALAARLGAHVLDKDLIRAAVFGPDRIEYSRAQDDHVVQVMYATVVHLRDAERERFVVIDGRTYSKAYQVNQLVAFAADAHVPLCLVECVAPPEIARRRLEKDELEHQHLAANRTARLYRALQKASEPIFLERLVIDTAKESTAAHVERCVVYLRELGWRTD